MKFALVDARRSEPSPKLKGICSYCASEMVAKCGRVKQWHWAHKSKTTCDPWWETETEWHRNWKNEFPDGWQEIVHFDELTGEKHIADVKTEHGLVIEFQNSPMSLKELQSREKFYDKMIWIVNGNRGSLDASNFNMGLSRKPIQKNPLAYKVEWWGRSRLLRNWSEATTKVFLDFGANVLWRLILFDIDKKIGVFGPYPKEILIDTCLRGEPIGVPYLDETAP